MTVDYSSLPSGSVVADVAVGATSGAAQSISTGPRHLKWPLRLVDGPGGTQVFATWEQDTLEEVTQSVQILLSTVVGERYRDAPDYGVDELLTGGPVNTSQAATAVSQFEPRASVAFATTPIDATGQQAVTVTVTLVEGAVDVSPALDR